MLKRVLFFAGASRPSLTDRAREIIAEQVHSSDEVVSAPACVVAYASNDHELNQRILLKMRRPTKQSTDTGLWRSRAIAVAVAEQKKLDLLSDVDPRYLGYVASQLKGNALDIYAEAVERVIKSLVRPLKASPPADIDIVVNSRKNGLELSAWPEEVTNADDANAPDVELLEILSSPSVERFNAQYKVMRDTLINFQAAVTREGVDCLLGTWEGAFGGLVKYNSAKAGECLDVILATTDDACLRRLHNLGTSLAGAYAAQDGAKSAAVFNHLRMHRPIGNVVIGPQQIPLYHSALFEVPTAAGLEPLREQLFLDALDDAAIEVGVLSAESAGFDSWLDSFVDRLAGSSRPADQALALTIAGLRRLNRHSEKLLQSAWGSGFLGDVHAAANKAYCRAEWTRYWLGAAVGANEAIDFWRFGKLAEGVADWRFVAEFRSEIDYGAGSQMQRFSEELYARLEDAAKERSKKRRTTLFGMDAPDFDLVQALIQN